MKSIFLNKISNIVSRFSSTVSELFSVIRGLFLNVICGLRPANLDCRIRLCITSGNDGYRGRLFSGYSNSINYPSPDTAVSTSPARGEVLNNITFKGLDVVRQYAALLERRVQSSTRVRKAQVVTRQTKHIRNLLPQCASDATGFLSDVYKKSTRAQKFLADGVQYGRSMIEMLGVLAIIGVLSVGGIAGYSKAMTKWKTNKTIEQTTNFIDGLTTLALNQKQLRGTNDEYPTELGSWEPGDIELFKTLGIIDEEMLVDGELKTPFGGEFYFSGGDNEIDIGIYGLPREACMALATTTWGNGKFDIGANNIGYTNIAIDCHNPNDEVHQSYNDEGIVVGCYSDGGVPLTPDKAAYGCSCKDATCNIDIHFENFI